MLNICLGQQTKQKNIQPSYFVRALAVSTELVSEKYKKCVSTYMLQVHTSTSYESTSVELVRILGNSNVFGHFI